MTHNPNTPPATPPGEPGPIFGNTDDKGKAPETKEPEPKAGPALPAAPAEPKPSIGRIVHYVTVGQPGNEYPGGKHRAALITEVGTPLEKRPSVDAEKPVNALVCDLTVFQPTGQLLKNGVPYSREPKPGTWHWPERE